MTSGDKPRAQGGRQLRRREERRGGGEADSLTVRLRWCGFENMQSSLMIIILSYIKYCRWLSNCGPEGLSKYAVTKTKERGIAKMRKGRLTNDCVPSRDDAVKDAIKHDPMRKQGGHDLAHHPAKRRSYNGK